MHGNPCLSPFHKHSASEAGQSQLCPRAAAFPEYCIFILTSLCGISRLKKTPLGFSDILGSAFPLPPCAVWEFSRHLGREEMGLSWSASFVMQPSCTPWSFRCPLGWRTACSQVLLQDIRLLQSHIFLTLNVYFALLKQVFVAFEKQMSFKFCLVYLVH